jgi:hypothetical protein
MRAAFRRERGELAKQPNPGAVGAGGIELGVLPDSLEVAVLYQEPATTTRRPGSGRGHGEDEDEDG